MINSKNIETTGETPPERDANPNIPPPPAYPLPTVVLPTPQETLTEAQIGERYRAELFAQCAKGNHEPSTKHGVFGIITAVLCFPIGLICLFTDAEKVCSRCGVKL